MNPRTLTIEDDRDQLREQCMMREAAWNSYTRLAARVGCDAVGLAESDVLGKLWDHYNCNRGVELQAASAVYRAINQCRQTEDAT